jgi:hypothetical protein
MMADKKTWLLPYDVVNEQGQLLPKAASWDGVNRVQSAERPVPRLRATGQGPHRGW